MVSSVLWEDCMQNVAQLGIVDFFECGPGRVLTGLARRINKDWVVRAVSEFSKFGECLAF